MDTLYQQTTAKTITRLQETKRGRISIFFDDEFAFSVDEETFVRYQLKVGQRYSEQEYEQLYRETQYMRAKEKAFVLLSAKSYTRKMLSERLQRDFDEDSVQEVLDRLEELGLLNDADYALCCAKDLVGLKHYSLSRVRQELAHRGISQNEIEDTLTSFEEYDESQAIRAILEKKYSTGLQNEKGRRKAFNALLRLGYDMGDIRCEMEKLLEDLPEEETKKEQEETDPDEEIRALLIKKYQNALGEQKGIDRAIRGLIRRGYHYSDIRRVLDDLMEE